MDFEEQEQLNLRDIKLIKKGGTCLEQGISNLFKRYYHIFIQYYRRTGRSEESAEDLVQDVFVKVVRKIDTFRGDSPFGAWIWMVVKRTGYDKPHTSKETATEDDVLEFIIGGAESSNNDDITNCVRKGFNLYANENNERAQVLTLISFNGWDISEIAKFIERTPGATREYISQCRKKLKPFIEHCLELLTVA